MPVRVLCSCGTMLQAPDEFANVRAECPYCRAVVTFPPLGVPPIRRFPQSAVPPIQPAAPPIQPAAASVQAVSAPVAPPSPPITAESAASPAPPLAASEPDILTIADDPPASEVVHFFDPPAASPAPAEKEVDWFIRMMEVATDPRSIQWMLMLGGGLMVVGIIIWLVSIGILQELLKNKEVLAATFIASSLAILGVGWWVTLSTNFKLAGKSLAFLGCVVLPMNLWFLSAQEMVTLKDHLWIGGLFCTLLYVATVYVLRDPLFLYAVEIGISLTLVLLLGVYQNSEFSGVEYAINHSLLFLALGLISIHLERAFRDDPDETFNRQEYGMPLFWAGHLQLAAGLGILLASQALAILAQGKAHLPLPAWLWLGSRELNSYLLAGGIWLAGAYAYLYSDLIVRKSGIYVWLAGLCFLLAVTTVVGHFEQVELMIIALAMISLAVTGLQRAVADEDEPLKKALSPLALIVAFVPIVIGFSLHVQATSSWVAPEWRYTHHFWLVGAQLIVALTNRLSAYLSRDKQSNNPAAHIFLSAAGLLLAAAALLRGFGMVEWVQQAPILLLIPIAYLAVSWMWRGQPLEGPLGAIAHTAAAVILLSGFVSSVDLVGNLLAPREGLIDNLLLGLLFAEAVVFYSLAAWWRRRSVNVYFAVVAACLSLWQLMGYAKIDAALYTPIYAGFGFALLIVARVLGIEEVEVFDSQGRKTMQLSGKGETPYLAGNGVLLVASLAALLLGLKVIAIGERITGDNWGVAGALLGTTLAAILASFVVVTPGWRNAHTVKSVALGIVTFLAMTLNLQLSPVQKGEIFAVVAGLVILTFSHIGRFRETGEKQDDSVSFGLWFGSLLAVAPLFLQMASFRLTSGPSLVDEIALLSVSILLVLTGVMFQVKSTTTLGGLSLSLYLLIVIGWLIYSPAGWVGVFLMGVGGSLFAIGLALSIYRDQLKQLPEQIERREGIFRVISWR